MTPTNIRNAISSVLSVMAAGGLLIGVPSDWYVLLVPIGLLLLSSGLVHRAALAPQILVRAAWWANLALGTVLATSGGGNERTSGVVLALACGAALLVSGRRALSELSGTVAVPAALRSMLMLLMIFALADAQTFLLFGTVGLIESSSKLGAPALMLTIGTIYVVGFVGLYRLQLWGAILNVLLSIGVLVLLGATTVIDKSELSIFLTILAAVHVIAAAPVTIAALSGKDLKMGLSPQVRGVVTTVVIAGLMIGSIVMWCFDGRYRY